MGHLDSARLMGKLFYGNHLLIGDKGFIKPFLKQELAEQEINLQTPLRKKHD